MRRFAQKLRIYRWPTFNVRYVINDKSIDKIAINLKSHNRDIASIGRISSVMIIQSFKVTKL
jgi:hypothetical protein